MKHFNGILVLLQLICLVSRICAQGVFVYDQQSADESGLQEGGMGIQSNQPIGQSFTPTNSAIGFIRLYLYTGSSAVVQVNLRAGSLVGDLLAITDSVNLLPVTEGFFNFTFSNLVPVVPGTTYYFQPVASTDTVGINKGQYSYPGGTAFYLGVPNAQGEDFWFREGIIVPEPASVCVLLLGAGALVVVSRRFRN